MECKVSDEDHSEDIEDLGAELKRRDMAYKFMAQNLAQHVEKMTKMGDALNTGTILIDALMAELRLAGKEPSVKLQVAHDKWNEAMKRLFGHDR